MIKSKPTFHIIEGYSCEDRFEDFRSDFINGVKKKDLLEKYDISNGVYLQWRDRIFEELPNLPRRRTGGRQPQITPKYRVCDDTMSFSKRTYNGNYTVCRRVNRSVKSYGTYPSKEIAENVRGELALHNWNRYVAYDLINEYAIRTSKRCLLPKILERKV